LGFKTSSNEMPNYIQVKQEDEYRNTALDEEHANYIKTVMKNNHTFIRVLENDRALSNMLYDMIKKNINITPPNSPS